MVHSDDDGLVLPPRLAPKHVVLLPIYRNDSEKNTVINYCEKLSKELSEKKYADGNVQVELDRRDLRGGEKVWQHIKRGIPVRLEIGPRDIQSDAVFMARRDKSPTERTSVPRAKFVATIGELLDEIQTGLFDRALAFRKSMTKEIDSLKEFEAFFTPKNEEKPEIHAGFALCHWSEEADTEEILKRLKVSLRCIPLEEAKEKGKCLFSGKPSSQRVVFAKAY